MVTVEHGVGMGIVVNGQIYRGSMGIGAEFGHMVIRPRGAPCRCGKLGCIEAYVADYRILKAAVDACKFGKWQCKAVSSLTIEEVTAAAKKGEPCLRKIFKKDGTLGLYFIPEALVSSYRLTAGTFDKSLCIALQLMHPARFGLTHPT